MAPLRLLFSVFHRHKRYLFWTVYWVVSIWYTYALPTTPFVDPICTVIESQDGDLLGAHIATDGQWRFPENESVPEKLKTCIISFEDQNFYAHIGISATGIARAVKQNIINGRIISGGSTITQQVIRMMRKNPPRIYREKILEMILATRLEISYSKKEILALYASHAPFGNNVVGMDAAAWRYFGRKPTQLSWAESAMLAVLPNAPGLIYPGKNHSALLAKRNRLLKKLYREMKITRIEYALALEEPIPSKPLPLPNIAKHLMQKLLVEKKVGGKYTSTLETKTQRLAHGVLNQHAQLLQDNRIMNGAVMITEIETGKIVAYVGNADGVTSEHSGEVNCIHANRSSGSILKPLLFARSIQDGLLTPDMLLSDLPSKFGGFSPENFSGQFEGAVPAQKALSRSLNIPMVHLLRDYGLSKFHHDLKNFGFQTLNRPASHYGLSLILGGAEVRLWDVNRVYTAMAQKLKYNHIITPHLSQTEKSSPQSAFILSKTAIYTTFEALIDVSRPDEENNWRAFESSQKIAWKTGTSFGFRDAWAVGVSGKYCVTVWVGNADGEGRPGLTGVRAAAPILFDIFRQLPKATWFTKPTAGFQNMKICKESGHRAGKNCPTPQLVSIPSTCSRSISCIYHQIIHLDPHEKYRVTNDCINTYEMIHRPWFVLPPLTEKFYKIKHPEYRDLPRYMPDCISYQENPIGLLYPKKNARMVIPIELAGERGNSVFEASHRDRNAVLFWHIDNDYCGATTGIHQLEVQPKTGAHVLTIVDENGISVSQKFEALR